MVPDKEPPMTTILFAKRFGPLAAAFMLMLALAVPSMGATRTITDMRDKSVTLPADIRTIATLDDGFVEGVLTHIGQIDKVAVIGSWSMKRDYHYSFETAKGETYEHRGWNTMKFLHPWLDDKVCVNSPQGDIINFEALANANPDVVILRVGDCTVGTGNREKITKTIDTIEALGLPLVVLYSPTYYQTPNLASMRREAEVIGSLFGEASRAVALADRLASTETLIRERTAGIPEDQKTRLLYFGLHPNVRQKGGAGTVFGVNTPESYIIEDVSGARNAFRGNGSGVPMSSEQIYALDPDVIVLPTANGYHPPRELYEAPYYADLQELRAVKQHRVYAMPWSPMNCSRRVEYPLDMLIIAKAAYPDRFADISVYEFAKTFYKDVYGVDDKTAEGLRSTQLLDWMRDAGF